jgi:hypothetical protein
MPTCPACRIDYDEGMRFCGICGEALVLRDSPTHCPRCRIEYKPGKKFCRACGAPLVPGTAPIPAKEPPTARASPSSTEPAPTAAAASPSQADTLPDERRGGGPRRRWPFVVAIVMMVLAGLIAADVGEYLSRRGMEWFRFSTDDDLLGGGLLLVAVLLGGGGLVALRLSKRSR